MDSATVAALPSRLRLRGLPAGNLEQRALRAVLNAAHLLGLAAGGHLRELRAHGDPLLASFARIQEAETKAHLAWEAAEIIANRLAKIPERKRPHYTPDQRFRILRIKATLAWSLDQTSLFFRVCPNTVANWEKSADPTTATVGSTVKPSPPVRRFADVVQGVVRLMAILGFGGNDTIAAVLGRAGWRISSRTVARLRRRSATPAPPTDQGGLKGHPIVTRFVHDVWMLDLTQVKAFLGLRSFQLASVF